MGKKSKRRGAPTKESKQERRERQLEAVDQQSEDDGNDEIINENLEFFMGDRVWFADMKSGDFKRGIVVASINEGTLSQPLATIVPITEDPLDETKHVILLVIRPPGDAWNALHDYRYPLTLRYKVGD